MAGITTPDSIIDRVVLLLRAYLATEVALIDTRNNTVAGAGSDNNFTTPTIQSADIQAYVDRREAGRLRVIVTDEGSWQDNEFQLLSFEAMSGSSEPSSTTPRLDRNMKFGISVAVADDGGSQTTAGTTSVDMARRICNRVAEGVRVVMARYPTLSIPSSSTASLIPGGVKCVSDQRGEGVNEDSIHYYQRDIVYEARTIESRA